MGAQVTQLHFFFFFPLIMRRPLTAKHPYRGETDKVLSFKKEATCERGKQPVWWSDGPRPSEAGPLRSCDSFMADGDQEKQGPTGAISFFFFPIIAQAVFRWASHTSTQSCFQGWFHRPGVPSVTL
jgi:hypothetical protein